LTNRLKIESMKKKNLFFSIYMENGGLCNYHSCFFYPLFIIRYQNAYGGIEGRIHGKQLTCVTMSYYKQNKWVQKNLVKILLWYRRPDTIQFNNILDIKRHIIQHMGGAKWANLDNQSTTTMIYVYHFKFGSLMMRSVTTSSQICVGIGRGHNKHVGCSLQILASWHSWQDGTKSLIVARTQGQ